MDDSLAMVDAHMQLLDRGRRPWTELNIGDHTTALNRVIELLNCLERQDENEGFTESMSFRDLARMLYIRELYDIASDRAAGDKAKQLVHQSTMSSIGWKTGSRTDSVDATCDDCTKSFGRYVVSFAKPTQANPQKKLPETGGNPPETHARVTSSIANSKQAG